MLVLGGGPAGLTAAYALARRAARLVAEAEDQVGGLAKTVERDGYRFDLGGHRFFTKSRRGRALWQEVLGDELLLRPAPVAHLLERALPRLPAARPPTSSASSGPVELPLPRVLRARALRRKRAGGDASSSGSRNRFGRRLFELFFRSYTEKVWGVPTSEIRAEWAAQRIKGLSFCERGAGRRSSATASNVHEPDRASSTTRGSGPGRCGRRWRTRSRRAGGEVRASARVERLAIARRGRSSRSRRRRGDAAPGHAVSSLPLRELSALDRPRRRPKSAGRAPGFATATSSPSRSSRRRRPVPRQLDLHPRPGRPRRPDPELPRLEPGMVPDADKTCLGLEYFCFEGDELWTHGRRRARRAGGERAGAARPRRPGRGRGGYVVRVPQAYPIYDADYADRVARDPRLARRHRRTCSRSAATACTATTTPTTRC